MDFRIGGKSQGIADPSLLRAAVARRGLRSNLVEEMPATQVVKCFCSAVISIIILAGVTLFVVWLAVRPHRPRFHLDVFTFPSPPGSGPFYFVLTDRNPNHDIGIFYDEQINASVYYLERQVGVGQVAGPFYQPPKNTTTLQGALVPEATDVGAIWSRISSDEQDGRAALRLELTAAIRFKVKVWDTHRHRMHVECDVEVGADGDLLGEYKGEKCSIYFG